MINKCKDVPFCIWPKIWTVRRCNMETCPHQRLTFREIATEQWCEKNDLPVIKSHDVSIIYICFRLALAHPSIHPYLLANLVVGFDVVLALLGEVGDVVDLPAGGVVIDADVGGATGEVTGGADDARGAGGRAAQDGEAGGEHGRQQ